MHFVRFLYIQSIVHLWRKASRSAVCASFAALLLITAPLAAAPRPQNQKNQKIEKTQKDNKNKQESAITAVDVTSPTPLSDPQAIEMMVSQMLGAWQIGEADLMHGFYSDDVLVVSGAWEPPLQGWQNYVRAYQAQRARTQGARLERTNTFTKVQGDMAWCTYQWQFAGQVDGGAVDAVGQTSLVLEKRAGKWLIVLNHTSAVPMPQRTTSSSTSGN